MSKFLACKNLGSLRPIDDVGEAALRSMGQGEVVEIEVRQRRNLQHHHLFWALMSLVWAQIDDKAKYPTVEDLVTEVKLITGHYTRRDIVFEGRRYPVLTPSSISFAAMDQAAFAEFFERVSDWVATDILPGVTREDLQRELESMIGLSEGTKAEEARHRTTADETLARTRAMLDAELGDAQVRQDVNDLFGEPWPAQGVP